MESVKVLWGSSTKALEKARSRAEVRSYACSMDQCFQAVLEMTQEKVSGVQDPLYSAVSPRSSETQTAGVSLNTGKRFALFLKDRRKRHIVIMGVPQSVNTTEVGIFFEPEGKDRVRIEIASLSTNAKVTAAGIIFQEMDQRFARD